MSSGRGANRGRGRGTTGRSGSPAPDDTTTPRTPTVDSDGWQTVTRGRGRPNTRPQGEGPVRTRQQQVQATRNRPSAGPTPVRPAPAPVRPSAPPPVLPTPGVGEQATEEHTQAVRNEYNVATLTALYKGLAAEQPRRADLLKDVERQIIRAQLAEMVGKSMKARANIQIDGQLVADTVPRKVGWAVDNKITSKDKRRKMVWDASVTDAEVGTIGDIKRWADGVELSALQGKGEIVIQLVGTSGPCEACQARLTTMANQVLTDWATKFDVPKTSLPPVKIMCYYGNNPGEPFTRGGYTTYNGWRGDRPDGEMSYYRDGSRHSIWSHSLPTAGGAGRPRPALPRLPAPTIGIVLPAPETGGNGNPSSANQTGGPTRPATQTGNPRSAPRTGGAPRRVPQTGGNPGGVRRTGNPGLGAQRGRGGGRGRGRGGARNTDARPPGTAQNVVGTDNP